MARTRKRLVKAGHLRVLKTCAENLSPEARSVYDRGKAETEEEYSHIQPKLKLVQFFRQEMQAGGKTYSGQGAKEKARADKRRAQASVADHMVVTEGE